MNPIINPFLFYLMGISEGAKNFFDGFGFTFTLFGGVIIVLSILWKPDSNDECELRYYSNVCKFKKLFIIGIISMIINLFIPTQETCYQMLAASLVTSNNLTIAKDTAENVVDYIVESVDKLLEKGSE